MENPDATPSRHICVLGAGIVGLATALTLLRRRPGSDVIVLDKAHTVATAQTGHNSGVIHAGLYYAPGSLKARLCRAGERATKDFCEEHAVPYRTVGKLVVATDDAEEARLAALAGRARTNGIDIRDVPAAELRELEPHVRGRAAILSPATGIVDYRVVARAMRDEIARLGGRVRTGVEVTGIAERATGPGAGVLVRLRPTGQPTGPGAGDVEVLRTRRLVACAGLQADRVARMAGIDAGLRIVPFRGEYHALPAHRAGLVRHLIYPVPDPALPVLGVHLSPMIDGSITVGPNAVLAFKREGYRKRDFSLSDTLEILSSSGIRRVLQNNLRSGLGEMKNSLCKSGYLRLVQKYCPSLTLKDLQPWPAGVRAQAVSPDGKLIDDFLFVTTPRSIHTCNAPSPAATSAIPIGAHIVSKVHALLENQSNPGRTLRAARSVETLHAAFTR